MAHLSRELYQREAGKREDNEGNERELPVEVKEHPYHDHYGKAVADDAGRHAEKGVLEGIDVVGDARHEAWG